jgi:hypothetical protein
MLGMSANAIRVVVLSCGARWSSVLKLHSYFMISISPGSRFFVAFKHSLLWKHRILNRINKFGLI